MRDAIRNAGRPLTNWAIYPAPQPRNPYDPPSPLRVIPASWFDHEQFEHELDEIFRECRRRLLVVLEDAMKRKDWSVERLRLEAQLAYLDNRVKQAKKYNREADLKDRRERRDATTV